MKSAIFFAFASTILAAAMDAATGTSQMLGPVANLSATALLGWYLYYDTRFAKPALTERHHAAIERLHQSYIAEAQRVRDDANEQCQRITDFYVSQARTFSGGQSPPGNENAGESS